MTTIKNKTMTREDFLKIVARRDKRQGNYESTTKRMHDRERKLKKQSQQFIDVYEHLISKGYKVYVMELLQGCGETNKSKRWSHLYLPEINTSIRFLRSSTNEEYEMKNKKKLWRYLKEISNYCYTFVIETEHDLSYVDEKLEYCKGFYEQNKRKGIENNIIIPPKEKRNRIKVTERYNKI